MKSLWTGSSIDDTQIRWRTPKVRRVSGWYSTRRHSARSAVLLEYHVIMLAYVQMVWDGECVCDTRIAAHLYQLQRGILTILSGSFSLFFPPRYKWLLLCGLWGENAGRVSNESLPGHLAQRLLSVSLHVLFLTATNTQAQTNKWSYCFHWKGDWQSPIVFGFFFCLLC